MCLFAEISRAWRSTAAFKEALDDLRQGGVGEEKMGKKIGFWLERQKIHRHSPDFAFRKKHKGGNLAILKHIQIFNWPFGFCLRRRASYIFRFLVGFPGRFNQKPGAQRVPLKILSRKAL